MRERPREPPETRRAVRRGVDLDCDVIFGERDEPVPCRAIDLSPYGLWLETTILAEPGEHVVICFRPPNWPSMWNLTVFGEVARISKGRRKGDQGHTGMGIEFCDLTEAEHAALADCLRGLPPPLPRRRGE